MASVTYDDYLRVGDETTRYELIEGELVVAPSAGSAHSKVFLKIAVLIERRLSQDPHLGEVFAELDVKLSDQTVLRPDLCVVGSERLRTLHIDANISGGSPDLVIEVLSPATAVRDRTVKRELYRKHGAREYWLVSPEAGTVQVIDFEAGASALHGEGDRFFSRVLDAEIAVDDCFPASGNVTTR